MINFSDINQNLNSVKISDVEDYSNEVYILSLLMNDMDLGAIDFNRVDLDALNSLEDSVHQLLIHDEDDDDYTNVSMNPDHHFAKLDNLGRAFIEFVNVEKTRVPSTFRFL